MQFEGPSLRKRTTKVLLGQISQKQCLHELGPPSTPQGLEKAVL